MLWVFVSLIFLSIIASAIALVMIPGAFSMNPDKWVEHRKAREKAGELQATAEPESPKEYHQETDTGIETG